jgi:DNA repair protein RecO (recombination protein O)
MEWSDDAIVLGLRPFGENGAILEALTRDHGRHLGLVRGASSKRTKGTLEQGNAVALHWRARLDQQLGGYTVELSAARAAQFFDDGMKLSGLGAACGIVAATLPEREAHTRVFEALDRLLDTMAAQPTPDWIADYVRFEIVLLEDLGFGLDLANCAATGTTENLTHVSPKSGRAVSGVAAAPYGDRMLKLPQFLAAKSGRAEIGDLVDGLALTAFFLERAVLETHGGVMPPARARLTERLAAAARAR